MTITVLIADDHKLFRQGLISLMKTRSDLVHVVGEAETGKEAVRLAEQLRPDIVLMDIYMPDRNGLEATREIRKKFPDIAIVILTSSESDQHLNEAVSLGISGYLLKNLDGEELFDLLAGIERGEAAMTRTMAARLLKNAADARAGTPEDDSLTARELEVLRLVARGSSNMQIAAELTISVNTVKSHLKNILAKLQLENRTQVAAYAIERGLVNPVEDYIKH
jgi:two-component system, NarL family, nitrate/nitrite response regulator NarL